VGILALQRGEDVNVDSVTDTVGAGNSFMAGLISAWIHDESLEESLKIANAHGALSVMQKGAPKSISNKDIQELINST
jgi:Sugar kinases, ribokinase family